MIQDLDINMETDATVGLVESGDDATSATISESLYGREVLSLVLIRSNVHWSVSQSALVSFA